MADTISKRNLSDDTINEHERIMPTKEKQSDSGSDMTDTPQRAGKARGDGRYELQEEDCYDKLGFSFSSTKKWTILSVIFVIQCSMNFNASIYANAVPKISDSFGISEQAARVGQMIFLVCYAFGCELWAPWSEEFGRFPILQLSLFLVNIWNIPAALSPTFGGIVVCRALGGLSSAGGSVTLGMIADMWEANDQQYAVAFIVLSSVGGSVIGPVVGGFYQAHLDYQWNFWLQLIFGGATQLIHLIFVPETRSSILLDREAKRRRKTGEDPNCYGPNELEGRNLSVKKVVKIWTRPFYMLATEPIVLCLSLLSGFSDALIFTFLEAFSPVYTQWGFGVEEVGLAFLPLLIGYFLAYFSFFPFIAQLQKRLARNPDNVRPESRLYWLLYLAPLEAIGLFGFAWTSLGPSYNIPWIAPMLFSSLVGIANYAIYMATVDYMIAAYGPYAASATGGNGFARDFLAGIAAMYSTPFYTNIGGPNGMYTLEYPSTILACIAALVTVPIYIFYWRGEWFRERSKFAQTLAADKKNNGGRAVASDRKRHLAGEGDVEHKEYA